MPRRGLELTGPRVERGVVTLPSSDQAPRSRLEPVVIGLISKKMAPLDNTTWTSSFSRVRLRRLPWMCDYGFEPLIAAPRQWLCVGNLSRLALTDQTNILKAKPPPKCPGGNGSCSRRTN